MCGTTPRVNEGIQVLIKFKGSIGYANDKEGGRFTHLLTPVFSSYEVYRVVSDLEYSRVIAENKEDETQLAYVDFTDVEYVYIGSPQQLDSKMSAEDIVYGGINVYKATEVW